MKNTTHYKLKKPDITDFVLVSDLNENFDKIDTELKKANDAATAVSPTILRQQVEQSEYSVYRLQKDTHGVFREIQYKRKDGTLAIKSVLSGGTAPKYTTRTITYYATDGTTPEKTTTTTITYEKDTDEYASEVLKP